MPEFLDQISAAREARKHLFVWDKNGVCAQLAQFQGSHVHDLNLEQDRIAQGVKTKEEVLEKLRKTLIISYRRGNNLMIDIAKTSPDFVEAFSDSERFNPNLVFNYAEWHKPSNHMPFVREEEKKADSENSEDGYELNPEATLTIVSTAENERDISAQLAKIPHSAQFLRVIVLG